MPEPLEQPAEPVRLTGAVVIDGVYYGAGQPLPFVKAAEVPESLRHLIATDEAQIPAPVVRNIYTGQGPELGQPAGMVYHATSGAQWVRQQAAQAAAGLEEQAWAEAQAEADQALPAETLEVLEAEHSARIERVKAQMQANQTATENAYAAAAQQAEEVQTQFFVRRGGEMARVERAKLKPGELCFVKRPNGEMEAAGVIDANGAPPPSEIIL
jgi:hypothetical protein